MQVYLILLVYGLHVGVWGTHRTKYSLKFNQSSIADTIHRSFVLKVSLSFCHDVAMWELGVGSGKCFQSSTLQSQLPSTHLAGGSFARFTPLRSSSRSWKSGSSSTSLWLWRQMWLNDVPLEGNLCDHGPGYPLQVSWIWLLLYMNHPNSILRWMHTVQKHQRVFQFFTTLFIISDM